MIAIGTDEEYSSLFIDTVTILKYSEHILRILEGMSLIAFVLAKMAYDEAKVIASLISSIHTSIFHHFSIALFPGLR